MVEERAINFTCQDHQLVGILHTVEQNPSTGVIVVVGGPQYRVGSHRQFVLLARHLAGQGVPVLRFDYRGMGDAEGDMRDFEAVPTDIRFAIDQFVLQTPSVKNVVLWGLCDAASAIAFYAHTDERVSGVVLLNPWVRTVEGEAKAYLKHYYLSRLTDPDLWKKIFSGKFSIRSSLSSVLQLVKSATGANKEPVDQQESTQTTQVEKINITDSLPDRMLKGISSFKGKILLILSGDDLTADEFRDKVKSSKAWQKTLDTESVIQHTLNEANHTFSQRQWRDQVAQWTLEWVKQLKN